MYSGITMPRPEDEKIIYYTDGSCFPNPGKGGWAWICLKDQKQSSGSKPFSTNNEMEMYAALEAIKDHQKRFPGAKCIIRSDSEYVVKGYMIWMHNWVRKKQLSKDKKGNPRPNFMLWREFWALRGVAKLEWVRGHDGDLWNEIVDDLANQRSGHPGFH